MPYKNKEDKLAYMRRWWQKNRGRYPKRSSDTYNPVREAVLRKQRRLDAFAAYGGAICNCCGETTYEFLTIDHINNDGAQYKRRGISSGSAIYKWSKRNNYPPSFQVLCYNCNSAKGFHKQCPHKRQGAR